MVLLIPVLILCSIYLMVPRTRLRWLRSNSAVTCIDGFVLLVPSGVKAVTVVVWCR